MKRIINPWIGNTHGYNCFGCNPGNPQGVQMRFYWDGEQVVSVWKANPNFVSWIDTLHGGIQATLLDEICGWVVFYQLQTSGVTAKMEMRYRKPVSTLWPYIRLNAATSPSCTARFSVPRGYAAPNAPVPILYIAARNR